MNDFTLPETRYALSGDVNIAYQVMGAAMSVLFAATYPERAVQLVLFGGFAAASTFRTIDVEERIARLVKAWGTGDMMKSVIPSQAVSPDAINHLAKLERLCASPGAV